MDEVRKKWVALGNLLGPHGLKGSMHLELENTKNSVLKSGSVVRILAKNNSAEKIVTIDNLSINHKSYIQFKELTSVEDVRPWIGANIYLAREDFPALEEGEVYLFDLLGLKVFTEIDNQELGEIKTTYFNGAQDILVIHCLDGRELEIPFIDGVFVKQIDLEKGQITIHLPQWVE